MSFQTQLMENLAAERDIRTRCVDYRWWGAIDGEQALMKQDPYDERSLGEAWIKVTFVACPVCRGKGKYVNPSIDAHGLTREDFDEDPDFAESYFGGDYDIPCRLCGGEKVVPVPVDPEMQQLVEQMANEADDVWRGDYAEMMVGA